MKSSTLVQKPTTVLPIVSKRKTINRNFNIIRTVCCQTTLLSLMIVRMTYSLLQLTMIWLLLSRIATSNIVPTGIGCLVNTIPLLVPST